MEELSERTQQLCVQRPRIPGLVSSDNIFGSWLQLNSSRFLAGQLYVFRPCADLARVLLALAPLVGAALIAISRCEDYRHDVYDVTIGSALGIFVAYFSYRRYYPALMSQHCDRPYSSRAVSRNGLGKIKDEEESIHSAGTFTVDDVDDFEDMPLRESSRDRVRAGASGNT